MNTKLLFLVCSLGLLRLTVAGAESPDIQECPLDGGGKLRIEEETQDVRVRDLDLLELQVRRPYALALASREGADSKFFPPLLDPGFLAIPKNYYRYVRRLIIVADNGTQEVISAGKTLVEKSASVHIVRTTLAAAWWDGTRLLMVQQNPLGHFGMRSNPYTAAAVLLEKKAGGSWQQKARREIAFGGPQYTITGGAEKIISVVDRNWRFTPVLVLCGTEFSLPAGDAVFPEPSFQLRLGLDSPLPAGSPWVSFPVGSRKSN